MPSSRARAGRMPVRSRRPTRSRERIVALRIELTARRSRRGPGHDRLAPRARGPAAFRRPRPSGASCTPPGSSCPSRASGRAARGIRFEAALPNELWQSDFTHWRLADGSEVEIIDWLDDHSRYLLACTAFRRVSGDDVVATFSAAGEAHGWPAATLTDNGAVYTSRFTGGRNGVRVPARLPRHPPEERRARTIPRPRARSSASTRPSSAGSRASRAAVTLAELQAQLDAFRARLQRAAAAPGDRPDDARRGVPGDAQGAALGLGGRGHFRLRYDVTDGKGAMTLRRGGPAAPPQGRRGPCPPARPRHRRRAGGHGRRPRHRRDPLDPPDRARQGLLAQHTTRPRPMAGVPGDRLITSVTYVATHVSPMSRLKTMERETGFEPATFCLGSRHSAS